MVDWQERISIDPKVMVGKPCIAGTRIPVDLNLRKLAADLGIDQILDEYPHLSREDVLAVLAYASHEIEGKVAAGADQ